MWRGVSNFMGRAAWSMVRRWIHYRYGIIGISVGIIIILYSLIVARRQAIDHLLSPIPEMKLSSSSSSSPPSATSSATPSSCPCPIVSAPLALPMDASLPNGTTKLLPLGLILPRLSPPPSVVLPSSSTLCNHTRSTKSPGVSVIVCQHHRRASAYMIYYACMSALESFPYSSAPSSSSSPLNETQGAAPAYCARTSTSARPLSGGHTYYARKIVLARFAYIPQRIALAGQARGGISNHLFDLPAHLFLGFLDARTNQSKRFLQLLLLPAAEL